MVERRTGWWPEALLAGAVALITGAAILGRTAGADEAVRDFVHAHETVLGRQVAIALNLLGQGGLVTFGLAGGLSLVLLWRTRSPWAALPWVVAFLLNWSTVGALKLWTHRDAPSSVLPNAVEFFNTDAGYSRSFPSGHVVNAILWWLVIVLLAEALLPQLRVPRRLLAIPPTIVLGTTTYLAYHWLTDGLAALALGLLLALLVRRILFRCDWPGKMVRATAQRA